MNIFNNISDLQHFVSDQREAGHKIGFVPTMGALHNGHISLVKRALEECQVCVVSVFVNPTQFNDPKDLATYPRTFEADAQLLSEAGVSAVFHPSVEVVYPEEDTREFAIGRVAEVMEGAYRPGHFRGVMQVVSRLFDIVRPDKAFFGEKDFQQIAVIRAMCKLLNSPVEIIACSIIREPDGLALSSRNIRLTSEQRLIAPIIHQVLNASRVLACVLTPREVAQWVITTLDSLPELRVEYYQIVDSDSLEEIEAWTDSPSPHGCITIYCGEVRLIDNISYRDLHV